MQVVRLVLIALFSLLALGDIMGIFISLGSQSGANARPAAAFAYSSIGLVILLGISCQLAKIHEAIVGKKKDEGTFEDFEDEEAELEPVKKPEKSRHTEQDLDAINYINKISPASSAKPTKSAVPRA